MSKKYQFTLKRAEKILHIKLVGEILPEDGMQFIADYKAHIAKITPQEYTLDFDATELSVSKPESIPILQNCLEMYKADGIKKIILKLGDSPDRAMVKMQCKRVTNGAGLNNVEIL